MSSAFRKSGVVLALLATLAFAGLRANTWWGQGQRDDLAVWAQVQQENAWLVAILEPESKGLNPPCAESSKPAVMGGTVTSGDKAQGQSEIHAAQRRLLREGWSLSSSEELDVGDGLGARQRDSFERTISGRTATISFIGSEQTDRPAGVSQPLPDPPGVTITMMPRFCVI